MVCRTSLARTEVGSIPDFSWSGVKLPIWFLPFLFAITCVVDVQMAHANPFSTSRLWQLSNDIKNTSGVLTPALELWNFGSLGGLPSPHFGNVSVILTLFPSRVATLSMSHEIIVCVKHVCILMKININGKSTLIVRCIRYKWLV